MFQLHPLLQSDTIFLKTLELSDLLLMNDKNFPWFILVPRKENVTEIFELNETEQMQLWREILSVSQWSKQYFSADKMNIATLGNKVPQLHVHIIARYKNDVAWPKPPWGHGGALPYTNNEIIALEQSIQHLGSRL